MGFKSVYRVLMDIFPQVDSRILRAVAIENSKDADKAVEVVLMEVIPQIAGTSDSPINSLDNAGLEENTAHSNSKTLDEIVGLFKVTSLDDGKALDNASPEGNIIHSSSKTLDEIVELFKVSSPDDGTGDGGPVCGSDGNQVVSPVKLGFVSEPRQIIPGLPTISSNDDFPSNLECLVENNLQQFGSENGLQHANDEVVSDATNISDTDLVNYIKVTEVVDFEHEPMEEKTTHELIDFQHEGLKAISTHEVVEFEVVSEATNISDTGLVNYLKVTEVVDFEHEPMEEKTTHELIDFKHEGLEAISTHEVVEFEDGNALNIEVSQSSQICRIDLLEDIVKEARDNKKNLFLAMESVISLMREVEIRERDAEQAKEEAAKGPLDVLASVEDLKQMLRHAREANDMHAGEVYGEKAILATEAKELQSRLLCLSDERDNSLAILDEIRQTLEDRLDAAEKAMKAVEQEKMEKEEYAKKALTEQQLIMDKLVQESKILKQEAEENSKLQEFLMDRGSVVDTLQGEISVICQDIKLLKQKFDERVPLSESLSSSQTSYRLASSNSFLLSEPLDQFFMHLEKDLESAKRTIPSPSISDHLSSGEEREANDCNALVDDDGWEFCDNKERNM